MGVGVGVGASVCVHVDVCVSACCEVNGLGGCIGAWAIACVCVLVYVCAHLQVFMY